MIVLRLGFSLRIFAAIVLLSLGAWHPADAADRTYRDTSYGFTLNYPSNAAVAPNDTNNAQLKMTRLAAVVVTLNPNGFRGTNLGEASVSVGVSNDATILASCSAGDPAQGEKPDGSVTLSGIKFNRFTFEDAGVGNRYQSTVYRAVNSGNCYEVVEFLHWAAIENYPPGAVHAFDQATIEGQLHAVTRSFTLTGRPL